MRYNLWQESSFSAYVFGFTSTTPKIIELLGTFYSIFLKLYFILFYINMDLEKKWIKYFSRLSWTSFSCSLTGSWKIHNKMQAIIVLIYTLIDGIRMMYAWRISDIEPSIIFGAIYHLLGVSGQMLTLVGGILILESFILQLIILLHRRSLLQLNLYMNHDKKESFVQESKFIFNHGYLSSKLTVWIFRFLSIVCGCLYVLYLSESLQSTCICFVAVINKIIHLEFCIDVYMFYWLWLHSARKLSYSIDSLFTDKVKPMNLQLKEFTRVWQQANLLNEISRKLSTTCFVFGVLLNAGMVLVIHSLSQNVDELPKFVIVLWTLALLVIFTQRLLYFVAASIPLKKCLCMRNRIYLIVFHNKNISWKDRRHLLNVIKSQDNQRTQIALTTINGRLLETKLLGHQIVYTIRVFVLFLKIIRFS